MSITVSTYTDLITSEHAAQPNFVATVALAAQGSVDSQNLLLGVPPLYDLDVAVGAQLDAVGEWIGVTRYVGVPLTNVYFTWGSATLGWGAGTWRGPFEPTDGLVALDDGVYRSLLRARILCNYWDGTVGGAQAILDEFVNDSFPGTLAFVDDRLNQTMAIVVAGDLPPPVYLGLLATGALPLKPATVSLTYLVTSVPGAPVFGWGTSSSSVAGWGTGAWAAPMPT